MLKFSLLHSDRVGVSSSPIIVTYSLHSYSESSATPHTVDQAAEGVCVCLCCVVYVTSQCVLVIIMIKYYPVTKV